MFSNHHFRIRWNYDFRDRTLHYIVHFLVIAGDLQFFRLIVPVAGSKNQILSGISAFHIVFNLQNVPKAAFVVVKVNLPRVAEPRQIYLPPL